MKVSMVSGLNLNKPIYICAKMTMRCNSRCVHCNIWKMEHNERDLSTEQWLKALRGLRGWLGRFRMVFTGGEALLRGDMTLILEHAVKMGISVELLSNGLIIDEALAGRIVATGIDQVTISFDGATPAVHDLFRGDHGYHDATKAAIFALLRQRQLTAIPLRILLKTVISANNLHELAAIARFSRERGLEILYQPIEQNYGEEPNAGWYKESALWIRDIAKLKGEIAQLQEMKRQGYPIVNSVDDLAIIIRYFESPNELMAAVQAHDTRSAADTCRHALTNFVISSNGDVRMCFKMEPIGNLRETAPREIWLKRNHCWIGHCAYR
jgi:MoaA/NifB/PqqE/SkfB family radical SAM enzyme